MFLNFRGCGSRRKYDPSAQHHFQRVGTNWTLENRLGTINGVLGRDDARSLEDIGYSYSSDLEGSVIFGMATNMTGHEDLYADGMLGLSNAATGAANEPFIYQLRRK
ncbi:unnamed protein product [Cylicocyclus nassatus]|uniref:Uncharacterized protein n=1 Tax=Cylicocyclus nassatus TaxID=53992 RepID=A0AA36DTU1_CYLNA|nr:unnamed protein product [Cylicocyclus nassatus]